MAIRHVFIVNVYKVEYCILSLMQILTPGSSNKRRAKLLNAIIHRTFRGQGT
jgi:hypothetical protein